MNTEIAIRRAQVYRFLADVFLYPTENWLEDLPLLADIVRDLNAPALEVGRLDCGGDFGILDFGIWDFPALQAEHRRAFGLTGSLCYETEVGLPHEFRQSQEMADIAGFYRAFGFNLGGKVRERPDHLSAELEFMHILALKEAYAAERDVLEHVEICIDAQSKFLQEHLGQWIGLFADSLKQSATGGPFVALARFASTFVLADAKRLGVTVEQRPLAGIKPTPLVPEISCEACPVTEQWTVNSEQ
ncbi:MAG: molecular chaperone TorD family protein [Chloroflexi bacterium]|nr:molecular chaperone TorD family protein [Chloroflexota bacterium]